jgi:hypothetical protein
MGLLVMSSDPSAWVLTLAALKKNWASDWKEAVILVSFLSRLRRVK